MELDFDKQLTREQEEAEGAEKMIANLKAREERNKQNRQLTPAIGPTESGESDTGSPHTDEEEDDDDEDLQDTEDDDEKEEVSDDSAGSLHGESEVSDEI